MERGERFKGGREREKGKNLRNFDLGEREREAPVQVFVCLGKRRRGSLAQERGDLRGAVLLPRESSQCTCTV